MSEATARTHTRKAAETRDLRLSDADSGLRLVVGRYHGDTTAEITLRSDSIEASA